MSPVLHEFHILGHEAYFNSSPANKTTPKSNPSPIKEVSRRKARSLSTLTNIGRVYISQVDPSFSLRNNYRRVLKVFRTCLCYGSAHVPPLKVVRSEGFQQVSRFGMCDVEWIRLSIGGWLDGGNVDWVRM